MVTIRGIVIPVDWDEEGNIVAIAVSTHDEEEYLICGQDKGEELRAHIREEVEISGVLRKEKGNKTIIVTDYSSKKV